MKLYFTVVLTLCITLLITPGFTKKPKIKNASDCVDAGGTCEEKKCTTKKLGKCDKKLLCCEGVDYS
uniref:Beta-defensin-like protein 9 n=2 Tax=Anolis carolinensis TaxID=28377 RepID=G7ZL97_ANOCA|nr:beta-defensin-like protein 9 [Anolis carolinensis]